METTFCCHVASCFIGCIDNLMHLNNLPNNGLKPYSDWILISVSLWCLMPFSTIFQLYHGGDGQTLSHNVVSRTPCHEHGSKW